MDKTKTPFIQWIRRAYQRCVLHVVALYISPIVCF